MNSKENIYRAAALLFEQKGFKASTIRDIAQRVDLEPSSLYSHIRSKDEILKKICKDTSLKYESAIVKILDSTYSPLQKIELVIHSHIDIAIDDPSSITVFNDEWKHLQEPYLGEFIAQRRNYQKLLEDLINEAKLARVIKNIDHMVIVNTLLSSLQWVHKLSYQKSIGNTLELKKDISTILISGFVK